MERKEVGEKRYLSPKDKKLSPRITGQRMTTKEKITDVIIPALIGTGIILGGIGLATNHKLNQHLCKKNNRPPFCGKKNEKQKPLCPLTEKI